MASVFKVVAANHRWYLFRVVVRQWSDLGPTWVSRHGRSGLAATGRRSAVDGGRRLAVGGRRSAVGGRRSAVGSPVVVPFYLATSHFII